MTTLAFYISDNGYGHAARSIAIIRCLMYLRGDLSLVVCCGKALPFVKQSLRGIAYISYREIPSDLGYVLRENSLEADLERFGMAYRDYSDRLSSYIEEECTFLRSNHISLVLADISPVPFIAADWCGVTSIGISNFTWYTAYRQLLSERQLSVFHDAYSRMHYFISLPGAAEPHWGRRGQMKAGFFCRLPDLQTVMELKRKHNPNFDKQIVMFSPGMGLTIDELADVPLWNDDNYLFFVSSHLKIKGKNVISIPPSETESQNYVAASDIVITKPGWGTVSEAVSFGKQLCLIKRSLFSEDDHLIEALEGVYPYRLMEWEVLRLGQGGADTNYKEQDRFAMSTVTIKHIIQDISNYINQRIKQEW